MKKRRFSIGFVFGTRPEIIKLSPLIRLCVERKIPHFLIHTGQHYSYDMDRLFFKELALPKPAYRLNVRSKAPYRQGEHTGRMLIQIETILLKELPSVLLVHGDTNSTLAGTLAASKISTTRAYTGLAIPIGHVEAGLRSYDRSMPEEINRFLSDHLSDFLFAPTQGARRIAVKEGIAPEKVFVTGNTIVDAVQAHVKIAQARAGGAGPAVGNPYGLVTLHRQENVDSAPRFKGILEGLGLVHRSSGLDLVFPMHPRTGARLKRFGLRFPKGVLPMAPVGFLDFLRWESGAQLVLTDSGGVQEEACILRVPCVTLRTTTERPETVTVGANVVAGVRPRDVLKAAMKMLVKPKRWPNPFGDGRSAERIISILKRKVDDKR